MGWRLGGLFLVLTFLAISLATFAPSDAAALEQNSECLGCHEDTQQFDVGPVDRDTVCAGCHTPGLLGTHPYHQAGANCGAFCHQGWGESLFSAIPTYLTSAGSFASATSKDTSPAVLHQIHATPRWPQNVNASMSECSSCHLPASCTACHDAGVSARHQDHSAATNTAWTGMVCFGIIGEDQTVQSATLQSNYCSTAECHDVAGTVASVPLVKEDFSHPAYPEYGYPEANTVVKTGAWTVQRSTSYTGGQQSISNDPSASLSITFTGERVALVGDVDPYRGHVEIWIDSIYQETVDCYSPVTRRQQTLWTSPRLTSDSHTVTVKVPGTKNPSSRGTWVAVDAFKAYYTADESVAPGCTDLCHFGATPSHSSGSHLIHISSTDSRGPEGIGCYECHDHDTLPAFASGADTSGNGEIELDETDVCDTCHSPGGDYNGVDTTATLSGHMSVGAKDNWASQVYTTASTVQPGKERWCAGCHDGDESVTGDEPSLISGVYAPPVIGDEDGSYTYGTGWGFYETGHGLPASETIPSNGSDAGPGLDCDTCHDYSQPHIDGNRRTFTATDSPDDYRIGYRLDLVDGDDPMLVPWPGGNVYNSADNYRLCTQSGCHDPYPFLNETVAASSTPSLRRTNFWSENRDAGHNMHKYHLGFLNQLRWSADWSGPNTSCINCVTCHNVHGSQYLGMIHDGSLISDTVDRTDGMRIWYMNDELSMWNESNQTPPIPEDITLAASEGWIWSGASSSHLCVGCHGSWNTVDAARTLWQDYGIAPVLSWTGATGYEGDGANPDTASADESALFKISYADGNNDAPLYVNLLVDLNDDGDFEDAGEAREMAAEIPGDLTYYNGNIYSIAITPTKAGDNQLDYRFETSDGFTGISMTSTRTLTVDNAVPELPWTGDTGYASDGVAPDGGNSDIEDFEFRITYRDADDEGPVGGAPSLRIDRNDDGDYGDAGESIVMTDVGDPSVVDGKRYSHSTTLTSPTDDTINYYFEGSDGTTTTVSDVSTVTVVPDVNIAPALAWTGEAEYESDGSDPETQAATKPFYFRVEYTDANNDAPGVKEVWIDLDDDTVYELGEKFDMTQTVSASVPDATDGDHANGEVFAGKVYVPYAGDGTLKYCFHFEDDNAAVAAGIQETDRDISVYTALYVPSQYATIQLAVNAAVTSDTVLVDDGTYDGFAFNNRDITVESVNGPEATIIEQPGGTAINFNYYSGNPSDSTVSGFTIQNSDYGVFSNLSTVNIENCIIDGNAIGIYSQNGTGRPVTIDGCTISNSTDVGIRAANNTIVLNVYDTLFQDNSNTTNGSCLRDGGGVSTFRGCTFDGNSTSGQGGALYFTSQSDVYLSDCEFTDNTAGTDGGAIYFYGNDTGTNAWIDRCVFAGNSAANSGAVRTGQGDYEFTNCLFNGNLATGQAGGVGTVYNSHPIFTNCTFSGNRAALGGGIYTTTKIGWLRIHNCILWSNDSSETANDQIDGTSLTYVEVQYTDIAQAFNRFYNQVGNMYTDPLFVSPIPASSASTTTGDYHLRSNSPCEGKASPSYAPLDDIDGDVRPGGSGDDMGCDEITP